MRGWIAGSIVVCLLAAGCLGPAHPDLEEIPGDQSREPPMLRGDPLVLHMFFTPHTDPTVGHLFPNATDPAPAPAACAFYWGGRTQPDAACSVEGAEDVGGFTGPRGPAHAPWTLRFETDTSPMEWEGNASVFAYASNGTVVAWWTGAQAARVGHLTE